jgi:hypothetical protein
MPRIEAKIEAKAERIESFAECFDGEFLRSSKIG